MTPERMPARGYHTSLRGHIINARLDHEPGNLFATFFDQTSPAGQLRLTARALLAAAARPRAR